MDRYYLPAHSWDGATLVGDEAHHCAQVMRQKVGAEIEVFDGKGHCATARIMRLSKQEVELEWLSEIKFQERVNPSVNVHLCLPKPKAFDWLLIKLVELGVNEFQTIVSQHCSLNFKAADYAKKEAKWRKMLLEACKQCGQNWLPELKPIITYQAWVDEVANKEAEASLKLVGALLPESQPLSKVLAGVIIPVKSVDVLIGPEGDLSGDEYEQAMANHWKPCALGPLVLRVETALIYAISSVQLTLNPKY